MTGAAYELAAERYKGRLVDDESVSTIGTSETELLGGDPERVTVTIVNLSSNDIYLAFRPGVSAGQGIVIGSGGGALNLNAEDDGILVTRPMYVVAAGASSNVYVLTQRRDTAI